VNVNDDDRSPYSCRTTSANKHLALSHHNHCRRSCRCARPINNSSGIEAIAAIAFPFIPKSLADTSAIGIQASRHSWPGRVGVESAQLALIGLPTLSWIRISRDHFSWPIHDNLARIAVSSSSWSDLHRRSVVSARSHARKLFLSLAHHANPFLTPAVIDNLLCRLPTAENLIQGENIVWPSD
jgi:hypothetical protein